MLSPAEEDVKIPNTLDRYKEDVKPVFYNDYDKNAHKIRETNYTMQDINEETR